jgi:thiol-disulfide isomerase/thioredoxin
MPLIEVLKPEKKMLTVGLCCAAIIILVCIFLYNNYKNGHFKLPNFFKNMMSPFSNANAEKDYEVLTSEFVEDLTSESQIEDILKPSSESKILLVHTNWCGHCRNMMKAYMDAAKLDQRTKWYRIDASKAPNFVKRKDLKGFPTIYGIFSDNGTVTQHSGSRDVQTLLAFSQSLISSIKKTPKSSKHKNDENSDFVGQAAATALSSTEAIINNEEKADSEKSFHEEEEEEEDRVEEDDNEEETEND